MSGEYPSPGSVWTDADGRELTVYSVAPGARLGREVRGRIIGLDGEERDYATDQKTWAAIWRDRAPRAPFRQ